MQNNKKTILNYAGIVDKNFNFQHNNNEVADISLKIINNNKIPKNFKIVYKNELIAEHRIQHGIYDVNFSIEILNRNDELIFLIDGINFNWNNLTSWENNEVYSKDQLFLEEIKINNVDITLGNLNNLFKFNLSTDVENRNPRAIISNGSLSISFSEPINKKVNEIKKFMSGEPVKQKTQRLLNYIDKNFKSY
jgi:hypothetical protein